MVQLSTILCAATAVLAVDALAFPATKRGYGAGAKAVYFQTNKSPNKIAAIPVSPDGHLFGGTMTPTGGDGGPTVDVMTGGPAGPDALSAQGSVQIAGNYLFTTNTVSNSISMFWIAPWDATKLFLISQRVTTGDFPTTIAVSQELGLICVGLTGARSGISCANYFPWGLGKFDALRPYNLGQSNPPTSPFNGVADTAFSADSTKLITTVKGDPTAKTANVGYISVFPVTRRGVGYTDTRVSPPGTHVLFGFTQIPGTDILFVTDAAFGTFTVSLSNLADVLTTTVIPDQGATCWAEISPATSTAYVTDPNINHLVNINPTTGAIIQSFLSTNGNTAMIDFVAVADKVYALAPGDECHVAVFDVVGGITDFQNYAIADTDKTAQGLAVKMR